MYIFALLPELLDESSLNFYSMWPEHRRWTFQNQNGDIICRFGMPGRRM